MSRLSMITLCLVLTCAPAACGASGKVALQTLPEKTRANILAAREQPDCVRVVDAYVSRTRAWNATTYFVALSSSVADGRAFDVLHEEDLADPLSMAERRSFHVELDQSCSKVTEELRFQ